MGMQWTAEAACAASSYYRREPGVPMNRGRLAPFSRESNLPDMAGSHLVHANFTPSALPHGRGSERSRARQQAVSGYVSELLKRCT